MPVTAASHGPVDALNWTNVVIDPRVRRNAYLENNGALGDYFTRKVALGPRGSIWGLTYEYAIGPDGGRFDIQLASVASPNPNRGGVNDAGTLTDNALSYHALATFQESYDPVFADSYLNGFYAFRIAGADGAAFTAFGANDPYTGYRTIDGGAGVYSIRLVVSGQNGASSGFKCRITALTMLRLDDAGFF